MQQPFSCVGAFHMEVQSSAYLSRHAKCSLDPIYALIDAKLFQRSPLCEFLLLPAYSFNDLTVRFSQSTVKLFVQFFIKILAKKGKEAIVKEMAQSTLGERLQQARIQKGISLEEVAAKTNISKEILEKFEANDFNIPLPKIYARGFFTSYVKFLDVNTAAFLAEYETFMGETKPNLFPPLGHLELESGEENVRYNPEVSASKGSSETKFPRTSIDFQKIIRDKRFWYGLLVLFALLLLCRCSSKKSKNPETSVSHAVVDEVEILPALERESAIKTEILPTSSIDQSLPSSTKEKSAAVRMLTLVASDTVQVFVRTEEGKKTVFSGILQKGERKSIPQEGALQIAFSNGNRLVIEQADGRSIQPEVPDRGWIRIL